MSYFKIRIKNSDYLRKLKDFKAFMKHYNRFKRKIWNDANPEQFGEEIPIMAYYALLTMHKIPIFHPEENTPHTWRELTPADRVILETRILPVINTGNDHTHLCHSINTSPFPFMPLREYINYYEDAAYYTDKIRRDEYTTIKIFDNIDFLRSYPFYTVADDSLVYPIEAGSTYFKILEDRMFDKPITVDQAMELLETIHNFKKMIHSNEYL